MDNVIYLDNAATTKPCKEAAEAVMKGLECFGNPSSLHSLGLEAETLVSEQRQVIADAIGVKKTAYLSMICALPFLFCGDNHMFVSLIGVMFFSMTMSITLALIVSVLQKSPGLAFGFTTIGLFLGTAPIFFFKFTTTLANCIVIAILTALCLIGVSVIAGKDGGKNEQL